MKAWVYIAKCDEKSFKRLIRLPRKILPSILLDRAGRFDHQIDACRYLMGRHLLFNGLTELTGEAVDLALVKLTNSGKPYMPELPAFNISHSGDIAVCAIFESGSVGIDIEMIKEIDISHMSRVFTRNELNAIYNAGSSLDAFYGYWTRKEAVLKADGCGVNFRLSELETTHDTVGLNGKNWFLKELSLSSKYRAHISTGIKNFQVHLSFRDP